MKIKFLFVLAASISAIACSSSPEKNQQVTANKIKASESNWQQSDWLTPDDTPGTLRNLKECLQI